MVDDYCDCAEEYERRIRLEAVGGGQYQGTSGWASLFNIFTGGGRRNGDSGGPGGEVGAHSHGGYGGVRGGYGPGGHTAGGRVGYGPDDGHGPADGRGPRGSGAYGTTENSSVADFLIPIIGGGLVFLGLMGLLYRWYDGSDNIVKSTVKQMSKQVMETLCDPTSSTAIATGFGKGVVGCIVRPRDNCTCGKTRILTRKLKHALDLPLLTFPVIPGLHECTDDEKYEEGVFVAPDLKG